MHLFSHLIYFSYLIFVLMSRNKNPEIYVKGYGKNITKDDLKEWFREFGKIVCIQYKGPYSFIVTTSIYRNFKITMMLNLLSNK